MTSPRNRAALVAACVSLAAYALSGNAHAQSAPPPDAASMKEAGVHFQRAVALYGEADYRAALVEFKRAQEIAPSTTVLYNLGQTEYQLQNYAAALTSFERYLAEGGTNHKSDVQAAIGVLKTRVGNVDVTTPTPGWDVSVDDEPVGRTPFGKPMLVSIGRRKIGATKLGETPVTRIVEVGAGDTVPVAIGSTATPPRTGQDVSPADEHSSRGTWLTIGWIGTGALAVGATVTGIVALSSASKLKDARNTFPANQSDIDSKGSTTTTFAVLTDVLGASAIVLGGVTLYFTLSKPSASPPARVGLAARGNRLFFEGTF